jgi:RNA 2',3'-cyclic 3'-phosphodiesterase
VAASEKKRLFLAASLGIGPTRKIADAIGRLRAVAEKKGVRVGWVPPSNLHVTLKFLGWVSPEVAAAVEDRAAAALAGVRAFELGARGMGAYPTPATARVLWVGIQDPSGTLAQIASLLEAAMAELGFARETRPFSGHLTVGRVKDGKGAEEVLAPHRATDFGNSIVREVVLYESHTKSTGSEYTALARIALEGGPSRPDRQTRGVEPPQESEDPNGGQP